MAVECEITQVDAASDAKRWDEYVLRHPRATFFHLSGWGRVVAQTFSYRSFSCMAQRDGQITGILPLFVVPHLPFGSSLVSAPFAVYGGICADDTETERALLRHTQILAQQMGARYLELRHQVPIGTLTVKELYATFRKEIFPEPEKNMATIPRKQRRMIRQGEKHGLSVRVGGEEFLMEFYQLFSHTMRNHGTPMFPLRYFVCLLQEFGPNCRILAVFREGRMVAGVLTFFFRNQVLPHYAGARREAFHYAVNDFMYWHLLCYGAEQGYRVFDFGRSKQGTGAYQFKCHWGFEPIPLAYQYYLVRQTTVPDLNPLNPRFSLAIHMWKCLPLWLTQRLGPAIVRFFP
jgi:FemAB-related protein (PEP-CTERM system-associated)